MPQITLKKTIRNAGVVLMAVFVMINIISAFHAYKFTHFSGAGPKMEKLNLSPVNKLKLLFLGADNPRPVNTALPGRLYKIITVNSNVQLACWYIPSAAEAKGTVLLFHGYTSNKSALLDRSDVFLDSGYNCLLVDFMGSGSSGGNATTIGFKEAQEVADCYNYVKKLSGGSVYLYGSSMGAVAIIKAIHDNKIQPDGIIIECPFGTMYKTVCNRFHLLHIPEFPLAGIMVFWGGIENGFRGFSFSPTDYAKAITCPTLLLYGEKDDRVTHEEIEAIYSNINGPKKLITYPEAGHDNYMAKCKHKWSSDVIEFLNSIPASKK